VSSSLGLNHFNKWIKIIVKNLVKVEKLIQFSTSAASLDLLCKLLERVAGHAAEVIQSAVGIIGSNIMVKYFQIFIFGGSENFGIFSALIHMLYFFCIFTL